MSSNSEEDPLSLRRIIEEFLQQRLAERLKAPAKKKPKDPLVLGNSFRREAWLDSASKRVRQLKLATHTIKAIHSEARGTNVYLRRPEFDGEGLVGTNSVREWTPDVAVENASALDVLKFLSLSYNGETVVARILRGDPIVRRALCDEPTQAAEWAAAFAGIGNKEFPPASHTLAKQLYFPIDRDNYHLLVPLYSSVVVHHWHETLESDNWGASAKAARKARREREKSDVGYREYLGLAVLKIGGTKPQNVSQLNLQRGGRGFLLPSLPPNWNSPPIQPPMHCRSVFERAFPRRPAVVELVQRLRWFLQAHADPEDNNQSVREERAALVDAIIDELLAYAAELRALPPGWSERAECRLSDVQIAWLDPESIGEEHFGDDPEQRDRWPELIALTFGNWLASALQTRTTVLGDIETRAFKHALMPHLKALRKELEAEREDLDAQEASRGA